MTTVTATAPVAHPAEVGPYDGPPSPISTRFASAAMIVGPFALLGAAALLGSVLKSETIDTLRAVRGHRGTAIAYVNLFLLAQGLLAFAWLRLGAIVARGSRRLGLVGGTLLALSMTIMAVYNGIILSFAYIAQGTAPATLVRPVDDLFNVPNVGSLAPIFIVIGAICLAVGAFRTRALPRVQAVAVGLFALVPVALLGGVRPLLIVAALGSAVALVPAGIQDLRAGVR
jgi:hypothetical protein